MQKNGSLHIEGDSGRGSVHRESASLLYSVFHASPSPILISRIEDACLLDVNEAWEELTGIAIDESVGRRLRELGVIDDAERLEALHDAVSRHEAVHDEELHLHDRAGTAKTVTVSAQEIDVEGEPCMLTVLTDITERNRTLAALKASEERFHMLVDSAPVLIWLADARGRFEHLNQSWLEFTGSALEEQLDEGWIRFVHPDDRDACLDAARAAQHERKPFMREYRLRRSDGSYRWVLDRGVPRFAPDGRFEGYIGSCVDIQEEKETHEALVEAKEHAEEMAKLKVTFLTNITHEIRTPLTVILGFTSILRQGVRAEYQRFVNLIERSGRRLLLMLDSMLDLAQLEAGTLEIDEKSLNIVELVEGSVANVRALAEEKELELTLQVQADRLCARVDHGVLCRVLNNLLDNALKFTDRGGVRVEVQQVQEDIRIVISDTGIGIDDEFRPHVFDPFIQESTGLDRSHQGSGLGLAVSKRLIELMGGTIHLDSKKNLGSTFTIVLPIDA